MPDDFIRRVIRAAIESYPIDEAEKRTGCGVSWAEKMEEEQRKMYCAFCKKQIEDDALLCPYCGKSAPQGAMKYNANKGKHMNSPANHIKQSATA